MFYVSANFVSDFFDLFLNFSLIFLDLRTCVGLVKNDLILIKQAFIVKEHGFNVKLRDFLSCFDKSFVGEQLQRQFARGNRVEYPLKTIPFAFVIIVAYLSKDLLGFGCRVRV